MLILSRKPGQSIIIGGIIEITVSEVRGDQVRIGVTAPRDVPVFRSEVLEGQNRPSLPQGPEAEEILGRLRDGSVRPVVETIPNPAAPVSPSKRRPISLGNEIGE